MQVQVLSTIQMVFFFLDKTHINLEYYGLVSGFLLLWHFGIKVKLSMGHVV